ncbi:MAG: HlyD family efflux transporter periplasmic adaptor subunit [Magnetococcales bacterium]|nr:HlyD family efflux transporter periplasmic adaptor subunit [Magnetococcales bacterium]
MTGNSGQKEDQLPPLRQEIRFLGWRDTVGGEQIGLIHDPMGHRFLQITALAGHLLSYWKTGLRSAVLDQVKQDGFHHIHSNDLDNLIQLLDRNNLLKNSTNAQKASRATRPFSSQLSKLFFIRVPLFNPDRLTTTLLPLFGGLFSPLSLKILLLLGTVTGLIMVHNGAELITTVPRFFTFSGMIAFSVTVVFSKIIHEMGHALAAKRTGCVVPSMGVAFAMGLPLAFTDVTDSWRLANRWARLQVALGGVVAESWLALLASWGWLILPDGLSRDLCLMLALGSWLATLLINLNPFMRFDGYHILSDLTGVTNLHTRASAFGRWLLRRALLGWSTPAPEQLPTHWQTSLALFGWLTWMVRTIIYAGLSVMVYHWLAKIAGVALFVISLTLLIVAPVMRELKVWWQRRHMLITSPGFWWRLPFMLAVVVWLVWPFSHDVHLPAVITPLHRQWIHPPRPAQLEFFQTAEQGSIEKGAVLAHFSDPDLAASILQSRGRLEILQHLHEQALSTLIGTRERLTIEQKIAQEQTILDGLLDQQATLTLFAPFSGNVIEADPGLRPGLWMATEQPLFLLVNTSAARLSALVEDNDLPLLAINQPAQFHPESGVGTRLKGKILSLSSIPSLTLPDPVLSSLYGGPIPTQSGPDDTLTTVGGFYTVEIALHDHLSTQQLTRGTVVIQGRAVSLVGLFLDRLRMMTLRELYF